MFGEQVALLGSELVAMRDLPNGKISGKMVGLAHLPPRARRLSDSYYATILLGHGTDRRPCNGTAPAAEYRARVTH